MGFAPRTGIALALLLGFATAGEAVVHEWGQRSLTNGNLANVGDDPALTPENVRDLKVVKEFRTESLVVATPVVTGGLMVTGDFLGWVYVVDPDAGYLPLLKLRFSGGRDPVLGGNALDNLSNEFGHYVGMQSTPLVATVTVPDGTGTREEKRLYVAMNSQDTMWCLSLDAIQAARPALVEAPIVASMSGVENDPDPYAPLFDAAGAYFCEGPAGAESPRGPWPRSLVPRDSDSDNMNASGKYASDVPIDRNGDGVASDGETADVIFWASNGNECINSEMWAIDAYTGELYWTWDPVVNDVYRGDGGGIIWTTAALNADASLLYLTTGNCVAVPQVGEMSEALVALDTATGKLEWHHQRRIIDTADLDVGTGPTVVDVPGEDGCSVVVNADKDGCIYGYSQDADIPVVGDPDFDPLRPGQQRIRYRHCFLPGTLNGGFNASNGAVDGRLYTHTATTYPGGYNGADDSNAFAIDVCTGKVKWASSDVRGARADSVIASGMLFQVNPFLFDPATGIARFLTEMNVVRMDNGASRVPEHLATVELSAQPTLGGGGAAIVDGTIYVPTVQGVDVVRVVAGSGASVPVPNGNNVFLGPYPVPLAPGSAIPYVVVDLENPYPLLLDSTVEEATGEEIPAPGDL